MDTHEYLLLGPPVLIHYPQTQQIWELIRTLAQDQQAGFIKIVEPINIYLFTALAERDWYKTTRNMKKETTTTTTKDLERPHTGKT